jgi:UDPglucose--hexose-1-phosphate uridylyltransferase
MPQLRKDPITSRWVIISSERIRRPSDFIREAVRPKGTKVCPFCAGHEDRTPPEVLAYRPSGFANSPGWTVRVVPNKFPALRVEGDLQRQGEGMYDLMTGVGAHEVIIESPEHIINSAALSEKQLSDLFWAFRDRIFDLRKDRRLRYVILFKNHGEAAGASLEHAHSQLIALPVVPKRLQEEMDGSKRYFEFKERCAYCDISRQELPGGPRLVLDSDDFVVLCPFAPRFPFETWILPKRHYSHYENIGEGEVRNLAWVLRTILRKIDKVLEQPAYNAVIHTAPIQDGPVEYYHWHIEIIPKLTRVAGFEWGTGFYVNPTPPEESAQFLREAGLV